MSDLFTQHALLTLAALDTATDSPLTRALRTRENVLLHADASAKALFETADFGRLTLPQRLALAKATSDVHKDTALASHYEAQLHAATSTLEENPAFTAALQHARLIAKDPLRSGPQALRDLQAAGWSEDAILTLSQIVAFVSFQSRYRFGLRLIAGLETSAPDAAEDVTAAPTAAPFTRDNLDWYPWIAPRSRNSLTPDAVAQLSQAGHLESDYFMLLARDFPVLQHRTATDKAIFYSHDGLPRAERELAATVTSKVNGCVYCASVHARKAAQLSHATDAIDHLLAAAPQADIAAGQSPRWQAQIRFAAQLAATPQRLTQRHLAPLLAQGLTALELLDLVGAVAFFSWANRLMLTLGEPERPPVNGQ